MISCTKDQEQNWVFFQGEDAEVLDIGVARGGGGEKAPRLKGLKISFGVLI